MKKSQKKKAKKSQKQGQRWIPCLKEPKFYHKRQLVKLAQKLKKKTPAF